LRVLLGILLLVFLLYGFLQTEMGQNWLADQVTNRLSRELQTKISIKHVKLNLFNFNRMDLEGVLMEDQKQDTLLYAGELQVRISDWFIFKDQAELKYVGLEDAMINLSRTDSVWNYAFLEKYFSATSTDTTTKKKAGISFDLKKVVLKNVSFSKKDEWIGTDMHVKVGGLDMDANEITVTNKTVDVTNLVLDNPYFSLFNYTGRRPDSLKTSDPVKIEKAVKENSPDWNIRFANITIKDGRFRDDKGTMTPAESYFDGRHTDFSKINGTLKNIGWTKDTVTGNISLSAQERSGLVVKKLKAKTTIHPKAMIFDELYLETNKSVITDYYAMHYNSINDMNNFLHDVTLEGRFNKATISSDDIAFFAPQLKTWKKNIKIDGDAKGTVDDISSKDLEVWAGNNTYIHGAVSLVGLPNIDETLINIDAEDLRTTYSDAVSFIPAIRNIETPDLNKLTYLRFKGTYTGFITDFVTYGTIQTNLGTLQTDLNMKFPKSGEPVYSGKIATNGFQLGSFIGSPYLGLVDFHGTVKGKGFKWKTLDMNVDGTVRRIQYGDYIYQNITAKGNLTNRLFNGDFVMKDPNADMHLQGLVDLTGKIPVFKATADIAHADLKALGLTKEDFQLQGKFNLDLQASSLSDMIGTARISNASLTSNGKQLAFDSLVVYSNYENGLKKLTAISNEFNATVTGDFDLKGLPDAFTLFLHRYYPSYIKAPTYVKPQVFTFDITTGIVEDYMKLIDSRLTGFNNSHITGSLNTTANTMTIDADVPYAQFKQYQFSDINLKGSGDLQKLTLTGDLGNAQIGDSLMFPQTSFTIEAQNDVSDVTINTSSNQVINKANLSAQIKTFSDGATILLHPSSFVLNGKTWTIEEGGELNFRKNTIIHGGVTLHESNQEIRLWTEPDAIGNWNNLRIAFQNVNVGDVSPFLTKAVRIEGLLNGEATIEDPQKRFDINSNLTISALRLDNDSIGDVRATLVYDNQTGKAAIKANNLDNAHHVDVDVVLNLKDTATNVQVHSRLTNFQLNLLNRFLYTIFSDINGYVTGNLDFAMNKGTTSVTAKARVHDASFKVNYTQVSYTIDDTEIELQKDFIDLNNIRIRDKDGNTAIVKGGIKHNGFANMNYDILIETESRQFELLNTTINDNQTFYGAAKGTGSFILTGPQNDMYMEVDMKASDITPSSITMPPSRTRESGNASFMVERKYGREMVASSSAAAFNMSYNIHLVANPLVTITVILDDLTGDAITGKGTGDLRISSGTFEPLNIRGRYDIEEGLYNYTFQSLKKFPFKLRKEGDNYIVWDGGAYDANVHLEAVYTAQDVSFAPLVTSGLLGKSLTTQRDDVNVLATLTGNLFRPKFDFTLDFPNKNVAYNSPDFQLAIQQIQQNQNELNKQVAYLIVFNSFAPYENVSGANPFSEFTYNTISGLLFGKVNEQLNKILSRILPSNATFSFTGSLYNRDAFSQTSKGVFGLPNQSNINVGLALPLFNERAHITLGGTFDVPLQGGADYQTTLRLFPDVSLELLLNKSGSIKATFFYKQNLDFLMGTAPQSIVPRRYGTSISYGREFDNLGELFGKKRPKPVRVQTDTIQKPSADSVGAGTH
jgi:hypothetical protein